MMLDRRIFLQAAASALPLLALPQATKAQLSSGSDSKKGTRVVTLGTRSGPTPDVERAQSSNVLVTNGAAYIIDAGDGVSRRLIRLGINFRDIRGIFITHAHSDHTGGLGSLMTWLDDRGDPARIVNVDGPPGTAMAVEALIQFLNVNAELRMSDGARRPPPAKRFSVKNLGEGLVFQDSNIKVTAAENTHFHFEPGSPGYGKYKSFAYRFDTSDRTVVFTGDTGPSDKVVELARGVDLLVSEATNPIDEFVEGETKAGRWQLQSPEQQQGSIRHHIEDHLLPEDLGKMAARANVKAVVMTHLQPSPNNDYSRYIADVRKHFSGQIFVARDLMEF